MNNELKACIINNEDSNMKDSKNNSSKNRLFKKIDKKYKIGIAIFIAIILGLLCILIFFAFHSSEAPKVQQDQTDPKEETEEPEESEEEEEEKREIKFLNLTIMPELEKFYKNFPYTLKMDKNGIIDINYGILYNATVDKLIGVEDYYYEFRSIEINEESKTSSSENYDLTLSCDIDFVFHSDFKFNIKIEEITNGSKNISYIMIKKKLASLTILEEDIQLRDFYKKKIIALANKDLYSVEDKAKELDELFDDIGYYIPKKIIIGGYLYLEISQIENEKIINIINDYKGNINFDNLNISSAEYKYLNEEVFKYLFSEKKIKIVGGDSSKKSFDEWEKSVNYENAKIIQHSDKKSMIKLIDNFFDEDIKYKLEEPLKLVSQKYDIRQKYIDNLIKAKKSIKADTIKGDYEQKNCPLQNDDLIYSIKIEIRESGKRIISDSFSDIIVGWNITSHWGYDGTNGDYSFKDPILSKSIYFESTSKKTWIFFNRKQNYDLEIFLMKLPE